MWFLLRMTFWLAVVLVLLPTGGSQTAPKSQVSAGEAFSAARGAVADFEHFCERQQEASDRGRPLRSASARKQAPKCSTNFSVSVSDRTNPNPCELRNRYPFLNADRIFEPRIRTISRHRVAVNCEPVYGQPIINGSDLELKSPISL